MTKRGLRKVEDTAKGSGGHGGTTECQDHRLRLVDLRDKYSSTQTITNRWFEDHDRIVVMCTIYHQVQTSTKIWSFFFSLRCVLPSTAYTGISGEFNGTRNAIRWSLVTSPASFGRCIMSSKNEMNILWKELQFDIEHHVHHICGLTCCYT